MLPEIRTEGDIYAIPNFTVEKDEVKDFIHELKGFHFEFADCFQRSEPRENFFHYMVGQFSDLERKSIEPIALSVKDGKVRAMQRTISDTVWDDEKILPIYRSMINDDMGHPNGAIIFDETGFIKKGDNSIGVARQYCGTAGKVENCQVSVFAAYASSHGYALLDKRLFIPEKWFGNDYTERRRKCKLPESTQFKTKPQLAIEMFKDLENQDALPFKYIVADCLYGNSPDFIDAIDECVGKTYFVSIPFDTLCWLQKPVTRIKTYKYKAQIRSKEVVESTAKKPISMAELAKSLNDYFWYKRTVSEGTKGPIEYEFSRRQVTIAKNGLPWKSVWLIMRRTLDKTPKCSFFISNASTSTKLNTFVWLSGLRWAIEQCFEETKSEFGMHHYEVRKYQGWHHHILTCMLGHFFLWHLKIRLGKKSSSYYSIAA
jgi:SRSO17 transposase